MKKDALSTALSSLRDRGHAVTTLMTWLALLTLLMPYWFGLWFVMTHDIEMQSQMLDEDAQALIVFWRD